MIDLTVDLGRGLVLNNPVMTASGTFGYGVEFLPYGDISQLGAVVVKGTTLAPRAGNPPQRVVETPAGMLNSIGLQNPGVHHFIRHYLPKLNELGVTTIVNVAGNTISEYCDLVELLHQPGVAAIELNISCPNVKAGGMAFGTSCESATEVVEQVRKRCQLPLMVKLSPNVTDVVAIAKAVEAAGADSISLVNTFLGMAVDVHTRRPVLGNVVAGLSGPAIKPLALRMVWQVARAVNVPVVGLGGIATAEDALEFLLCGASAIQVGTANFVDPAISWQIIDGIAAHLQDRGMTLKQFTGSLQM